MHMQSFLYGLFTGKMVSVFENSPHQDYGCHKAKSFIIWKCSWRYSWR